MTPEAPLASSPALGGAPASTLKRVWAPVGSALTWMDRRAHFLLPIYVAVLFWVIWRGAHNPLWYDELFTYYIAGSKNWAMFLSRLDTDLNPPLSYAIVWAFMHVFGDSPVAIRLPVMLGFAVAGWAVFSIIRERIGGFFGLTAMVMVWLSAFFWRYAIEARPYGLMVGFLGIAAWSWMRMESRPAFSRYHLIFSLSLAALLLCHCFAVFFILPFFIAEVLRWRQTRTLVRSRWIALIAPMSVTAIYIPIILRAQSLLIPFAFQPTWAQMEGYYAATILSLGITLIPLVPMILVPSPPHGDVRRPAFHESAWMITGYLASPLLITAYLARIHGALWLRYMLCAAVPFSIGLCWILASRTKGRVGIGALFAVVTLCALVIERPVPAPPSSDAYRQIHPDLPLVAASGVTFVEMDHREPPDVLQRLYYLTDREAAIRYAHATMFEGVPVLHERFNMRANTMPYRDFVLSYPHFLVLAMAGYPEDWLLDKLKADGADVRLIAKIPTPYKDHELYEVYMPSPAR